jgi:hypothetical protein
VLLICFGSEKENQRAKKNCLTYCYCIRCRISVSTEHGVPNWWATILRSTNEGRVWKNLLRGPGNPKSEGDRFVYVINWSPGAQSSKLLGEILW